MSAARLGVVVIGRNEGERFRACLRSIDSATQRVVYVDSGSTDGSVEHARETGVEVVLLDPQLPFTAARARNTGWQRLLALDDGIALVQFVDGDCQLAPGWLEAGAAYLQAHPEVVLVHGRLRERFPEASLYNRICELEWNTQVGECKSCGGNAMLRMDALRSTGGYDPALIAGEEPELCVRLRARGGRLFRLDHEMGTHDAAMDSWRQWWRRCERAGYAYANARMLHGRPPERFGSAEVRSMLVWPLLLPTSLLAAWLVYPGALLLLLAYPVQWWRMRQRFRAEGRLPAQDCGLYALHCLLAKFPGALGVMSHFFHRLRGSKRGIIEYKRAAP